MSYEDKARFHRSSLVSTPYRCWEFQQKGIRVAASPRCLMAARKLDNSISAILNGGRARNRLYPRKFNFSRFKRMSQHGDTYYASVRSGDRRFDDGVFRGKNSSDSCRMIQLATAKLSNEKFDSR